MRQSYKLYDELPAELEQKNSALEIAREIHEIKKDYLRVLSGFEDFIRKLENIEELSLSEILEIVQSSSEKSIFTSEKKIRLVIDQTGDAKIKQYLNIFTILNNLIDNSIFACDANGEIKVTATAVNGEVRLIVEDDGCGIASGFDKVIFNPGFTTKYDEHTGKASTGIGLSHVRNLVDEMHGEISVASEVGKYTRFEMILPINSESAVGHTGGLDI